MPKDLGKSFTSQLCRNIKMKSISPPFLSSARKASALRFALLAAAVCLSRVIPHLPNFSPVLAICLWIGARGFSSQGALRGLMAVFIGVFASDLFMQSFDPAMVAVYVAFMALSGLGFIARGHLYQADDFSLSNRTTTKSLSGKWAKKTLTSILLPASGAVFFFVFTNFAVWCFSGMYPLNLTGLFECFALAVPFFRTSLVATVGAFLVFEAFYFVSYFVRLKAEAVV